MTSKSANDKATPTCFLSNVVEISHLNHDSDFEHKVSDWVSDFGQCSSCLKNLTDIHVEQRFPTFLPYEAMSTHNPLSPVTKNQKLFFLALFEQFFNPVLCVAGICFFSLSFLVNHVVTP